MLMPLCIIAQVLVCVFNGFTLRFKLKFNFFSKEYVVPDPPRVVLDKLEQLGYLVVSSSGIGQTIVWTLHRPAQDSPPV